MKISEIRAILTRNLDLPQDELHCANVKQAFLLKNLLDALHSNQNSSEIIINIGNPTELTLLTGIKEIGSSTKLTIPTGIKKICLEKLSLIVNEKQDIKKKGDIDNLLKEINRQQKTKQINNNNELLKEENLQKSINTIDDANQLKQHKFMKEVEELKALTAKVDHYFSNGFRYLYDVLEKLSMEQRKELILLLKKEDVLKNLQGDWLQVHWLHDMLKDEIMKEIVYPSLSEKFQKDIPFYLEKMRPLLTAIESERAKLRSTFPSYLPIPVECAPQISVLDSFKYYIAYDWYKLAEHKDDIEKQWINFGQRQFNQTTSNADILKTLKNPLFKQLFGTEPEKALKFKIR